MSDVVRLDNIKTRPQNEEYRKGWERIFGKPERQGCPNKPQCDTKPGLNALCYCSAKVDG